LQHARVNKDKSNMKAGKVGEESESDVMSVCVYMYRDQVRDRNTKAKDRERPNGKRTFEPPKRNGRKCATGQQQTNKRKWRWRIDRIRRVQNGRERWRPCMPRRAGESGF
jgi:hypothetical protein